MEDTVAHNGVKKAGSSIGLNQPVPLEKEIAEFETGKKS